MGVMKQFIIAALLLLIPPLAAYADVNKDVSLLPCGIYNQAAQPHVEKDLDTQSADRAAYTMEMVTSKGKKLTIEVQNVSIRMQAERNHVSVFLDGKPFAKTSHQDLPLYLEVHVDNEKYRIICTRSDDELASGETATAKAKENGQER